MTAPTPDAVAQARREVLDARFVARIRGIIEPLVPHIVGEYTKGVARGQE